MFKNLFLVGSVLLLCINGYAQMHDANEESLPVVHLDKTKLNETNARTDSIEKKLREKLESRHGPGSAFGSDGYRDREEDQMEELYQCIRQTPFSRKGELFACVEPMRKMYENHRKLKVTSIPLIARNLTQTAFVTSDTKMISLLSLLSSLTPELAADTSFQKELSLALQWNTENIDLEKEMRLFMKKMQIFSQHLQVDSKAK